MKLKFGYDVSNLTAYVNEEKLPLLMASVFSGETANTFEWQDGIKYKDVMNFMDVDVLMRADTGCSTFTSSGDTTFTQKEITVNPVIWETAHCPDDLNNYWARIGLQAGSYQDRLPFEQEWTGYVNQLIAKEVELQLWRGNTGTGSGNLALVDGFLKHIAADTAVVDATSQADITKANIEGIVENMVNLIPSDVEGADDLMFSIGWDAFKLYLAALVEANNFYIDGANASPYVSGEFFIPTYGIKMKAFRGLTATDNIVLTRKSNLVIGTDLKSDYEDYQMWYEKKDDKILTRLKYKLGTQHKFGSEIVWYKNS